MKTKSLFIVVLIFTFFSGAMQAQDKKKAVAEKNITWYGIDFTLARFTLVTEDPAAIVSTSLKAINTLILAEPDKYNLKKFFSKTEVTPDIEMVNERNSKIDPTILVVPDKYTITPEDVKKVINSYDTKGKTGMGLVFVAENLHKVEKTGSFYVVFFDMASKQIIDMELKVGKESNGIGFRNYWAGTILSVMKAWLK
jgi:hypothetical protein